MDFAVFHYAVRDLAPVLSEKVSKIECIIVIASTFANVSNNFPVACYIRHFSDTILEMPKNYNLIFILLMTELIGIYVRWLLIAMAT